MLISFALLLGSAFLFVLQQNLASAQKDRDEVKVNQIMNIIENEMTLAEQSPVGYSRTFYLPSSIDGKNYLINASIDGSGKNDVVIIFGQNYYVFLMPNSSIVQYNNPLLPGENNITKKCTSFSCTIVIG